jgi:hypothetical protein
MASQRELAAWHEAGHAAAMKEVSALNGDVWVNSHWGGLTRERRSLGWNMFVGESRGRSDALRVSIAGPLVESWVCRDSVADILAVQSSPGGRRWLDGDRVAAWLEGEPLSHWVRKTERLLRGCEKPIEKLAEVLYDHGWADGDEAKQILSGRYS